HLCLVILLVALPIKVSIQGGLLSRGSLWRIDSAAAQPSDASAKDAFEAARGLGTVEAWEAFLAHYPTGFYADLARAYLKKLKEGATVDASAGFELGDLAPTDPGKPAVGRGGRYMNFPERFNRYYTDPTWKPSRVVYVS